MVTTPKPVANNVLAIDFGTGTCQLAVLRNGKPKVLKMSGETSIPTTVYRDESGKTYIGAAANRRAYKNPANYFANFKTAMKREEVAVLSEDGSFTVIDAYAAVFEHLFAIATQAMPFHKEFPQFGGTKRPGSDLRIAITMPAADFGITQADRYRAALLQAGLPGSYLEDVAFFKEPYAASYAALAERGLRGSVMNEDIVVVIDIGAGTVDITVSVYVDGLLHAKSAHSGVSDLGGSNLTAAVASVVGAKLGIEFTSFERGRGLSFDSAKLNAEQREEQFAIWQAAVDIKHQLSISDQAFATVATTKGNREVELEPKELGEEWVAICLEIEEAICKGLGESGLSWSDVKFVVAAGGGSRTLGMYGNVARATNRSTTDVFYCDEPQLAIVEGAVRMAHNISEVTTSINDTCGFSYFDERAKNTVNVVHVESGRLIPPTGLDVESMCTKVISDGKPRPLQLLPFTAKPNVVAGPGDFVADSEKISLNPLQFELHLPPGEHPVSVRLRSDITQKLTVVLGFPTLPEAEALVAKVTLGEGNHVPEFSTADIRIIVLFDSSGSMEGSPIQEAKDSTSAFLGEHMGQGIECALVDFSSKPKTKVDFTIDAAKAHEVIQGIAANGGTAMAKGLMKAASLASPGKKDIVVMFSDGYPQSRENTIEAASELKHQADLYTIAIGEDADSALLRQIATSPEHFVPVGRSRDLTLAFETISTLIYTGEVQTAGALPTNPQDGGSDASLPAAVAAN